MERLWITQPRRATCLAEVTEVRGERFAVDRALFAPRSRIFRHPQYADEGVVWIEGEKRRLLSVEEQGDTVWYRLRGTTPQVGQTLQCELDQDVRSLSDRAHTAMHLFLGALQDPPPMVADPEVKGGGHFRLTFAWHVPADMLAGALKQVEAKVREDLPVGRGFATRAEAAHEVRSQHFQPPDPIPGPDVMPLVRIGGLVYPCDGTHVDRTSEVGRVVVAHAAQGKDGFVVTGKVLGP